jgi:D-3-phosphoglycerate dehydrogenase
MAQRPIILSLTSMHEAGLSLLHERSELQMASGIDAETLRREVRGVDGLIIRTGGVVDAALMDCGDRLRVVGRHGVGYDAIDVPEATRRGIVVVYTPGANTESVVQHVLAMMIGLSKHFPRMAAALNAGDYHARTKIVGRELTGRTLGIVGFGRIGRRVGETAFKAFGMKVLYNDIVAAPPEVEQQAGARRASFEEVIGSSEYITMHVPLDASTRRMIDRRAISLMRPDCILINCSRGPVVDEQAVADALDAEKLWGYGGDVFEVEPPQEGHPLIGRPDVMLTPHSAAQTVEGLSNMAREIATDVLGVLEGKAPSNPVNDPAEVEAIRLKLGKGPLAWSPY